VRPDNRPAVVGLVGFRGRAGIDGDVVPAKYALFPNVTVADGCALNFGQLTKKAALATGSGVNT
jgi:hypothetical protein